MTTTQTLLPRERTEEEFVAELKIKSTQQLSQFLAGAWTASIFSPETVEKLYQVLRQKEAEDEFVAELKTKSTQQLSQFLAGAWTASIFSPESIEELYQVLQGKKASVQERTEGDGIEVGQD
jgi:hypothetical protein